MITEDYVSFETAKLLREKGFDETCYACYEYFSSCVTMYSGWPFEYKGEVVHNSNNVIKCPTLQMTMKWLREVHKLSIDICTVQGREISYMFNIWDFSNIQDNKFIGGTFDLREQLYDFKTYEQACEAACIYALKNLI